MTHPMIGDTKTGERPRKPLMSDDEINGKPLNVGFPHMLSPYKVRDFYEAKITSGELVVRNKCAKCGNLWTPTFITKDRCPGCGAQIVDPM